MSYAPHSRGGPSQNTPAGYQYDDRGASQGYGYAEGGYSDAGYGAEQYQEPAPVAYHGKARYVEHSPANNHGGHEEQSHGYGQSQAREHGGYDQQGGYGQESYAQDNYSQQYQQDSRPGPPRRAATEGFDSGYGGGGGGGAGGGGYGQQRPPPQRPGHSMASPPDSRPHTAGRGMNERAPPSRQYTDGGRPNTSGSSNPRGNGYPNGGQQPPNGYPSKPKNSAPMERPLQNQPMSPQNMAWDNPFGSFGGPGQENTKPRPPDGQRPSTSHSSASNVPGARRGGEPPQNQQRPPRQASRDDYSQPTRGNNGQQDYNEAPGGYRQGPLQQQPPQQQPQQQQAYGDQRGYQSPNQGPSPASVGGMPPPAHRGGAPNFSRVQSPPIRTTQTPPNGGFERSQTMPVELPTRHTPAPTFQSDLPFREGRAQTPVYASPQYAEAQSAVIESVSDPPTATTEWADASVGHDSYHQHSHSTTSPPPQSQGHASGSGYHDTFDDYYGTAQGHSSHPSHGGNPHAAEEFDMPNFDNGRGKDELHLDSGTPGMAPGRHAYDDPTPPGTSASAPPGQGNAYQDHGFDFGVSAQDSPYGGGYDPYGQQDNQGQRAVSSPYQAPPGQPGGRGMPPGQGGPPGRGGYPAGPGRGGYQDRSVSAGPGPRPNGAPYGPPGPNGRGMPPMPMRGRGGPGFAGAGAPMSPGPGTPVSMNGRGGPMGARGRGGPPGPGGRGGPDGGQQPPAPMRPGLMQQGAAGGRPPPVRQYNSAPAPGQAPNAGRPGGNGPGPGPAVQGAAVAISEGPITQADLQRLRIAITDNPGDQVTTLLLVKKLAEASNVLAGEDGRADPKTKARNRERYINDAYKLLKKLVSYRNPEAMFYMAECYGSGQLGLQKDVKEAFLLYQSAAKTGHAPSAYRVAVCCELGESEGGGTKRDPLKAMQWYKHAATLGDVPAMYKLGVILLKGLLGQNPAPGEGVKWLQRAADRADPENAHALHELGLLYEAPPAGVANTIFADANYSYGLFVQAANLGYKFSQFRLGQCFEFGQLGCPIDPRQSIAWYSKAAMQEEHNSELALSGWYLTGSDGVIQQSDTEAYLWARKAANGGHPKAEYAMGYYTETGIGCSANLEDAKRWYWRASANNFPKARERLEDLRRGGAKAASSRVSRSTVQKNKGDCTVM